MQVRAYTEEAIFESCAVDDDGVIDVIHRHHDDVIAVFFPVSSKVFRQVVEGGLVAWNRQKWHVFHTPF